MNKLTKGTIAGAAGVLLLLGGAGTFALWNNSSSVNGGTVTSGTLFFETVEPGTWADVSTDVVGAPVPITDINAFRTVPGDILAFTNVVTVNATGNNLLADFGVTYDDTAVSDNFTVGVEVFDSLGAPLASPVRITDGDNYTVVVTLSFDIDTPGIVDQNTQVDLTAIGLTLTQVRPLP